MVLDEHKHNFDIHINHIEHEDVCGEKVTDGRHLVRGGKPICISCAEGSYYEVIEDGE